MKITIEYESSWRNSFLDGNNNEPLPKSGRNFIASMTALDSQKNYISREVEADTVMGVLNRLIGDQRKLYQSRNQANYYFADIEEVITFSDKPKHITHEMTYIRNMKGSTDQNSFTGAVRTKDPLFISDYSKEFWGILGLDITELCHLILNEVDVDMSIDLYPTSLVMRIDELDKKSKPLDYDGDVVSVVEKLNKLFPELRTEKLETPFIEKNGKVKPIRFYAAALYLQQRLLSKKYDTSSILSSRGTIPGFSKRGFNGKRDFMTKFTTGKAKKIWGNPYIRKAPIKGNGVVTSLMKKASGTLTIELSIERERARELENMIQNAGVSSFYLGKKGLAYVSAIRV